MLYQHKNNYDNWADDKSQTHIVWDQLPDVFICAWQDFGIVYECESRKHQEHNE